MAGSDQIEKLKERNEQLQKQLEGSKKKVTELQDKLKSPRSPPPIPKEGAGASQESDELQKKVEELTVKLAKQQEELRAAREERDEFARQLRTLREKLITTVGSSTEKQAKQAEEEPEYDPETQKYKLSWVGDSLQDIGTKKPPAAKREESPGLDRRTTDEKMAAMAAEQRSVVKGQLVKPQERKAEAEKEISEKQKDTEEELEETESYSVEALMEKAQEPMHFDALKDLKDRDAKPSDGPTVPGVALEGMPNKPSSEDSDVAVVTSERGGRPVLRMHAVPEDEPAEPTFKEPEESLATEDREEEITDKRSEGEVKEAFTDDQSEIMTVEKPMVEVPPPPAAPISPPLFVKFRKILSDHRAMILKSLLFLAGAGLGVGLALLIFLGPDTKQPADQQGDDQLAVVPGREKVEKAGAVERGKPGEKVKADAPQSGRAPAELVEPIYQDAAIMDKKEAQKISAELKVFVDKYPRDPMLRYQYARALYHRGTVEAAIAQLKETIKLDPNMPEVHYMLGGIYLRMGDEKKAHEALNNFTRLTGKPGK